MGNRMQKQHSDNEVLKEKMLGDIEAEKQNTALIQARCDNDRMRAIIEGEAEGLRLAKNVSTFCDALGQCIPDGEQKLQLFRFFQEQYESTKRTGHIASGQAKLFCDAAGHELEVEHVVLNVYV